MIIVLFLVFLAMLIASIKIYNKFYNRTKKYEELQFGLCLFGIVGLLITLVVGFILIHSCVSSKYIEQKISIYESENTKIEKDMNQIVQNNQKHEEKIFSSTKVVSPIVLMQKYPELKSYKLAKEQMTTYRTNNDQIKYLREKSIDYNVSKWWLYFGG